jgi:hypothetical protein
LAWQTPGAGVIRAGYGLPFGDIYSQTHQQVRWDSPKFLKVGVPGPRRYSLRSRIPISGLAPAIPTSM